MSLFRPLLLVIAGSTQRELARQIRYLKAENEILRKKLPARITITPKERQRLVKFGSKLGRARKRTPRSAPGNEETHRSRPDDILAS